MSLQNADEDKAEFAAQLKELFSQIDADGSGSLDPQELDNFLADPVKRGECAQVCQMAASDVSEVFHMLSNGGKQQVDLERFVDVLTFVGQPTTGKAIMKLEARIDQMEARMEGKLTAMAEKTGSQSNHDSVCEINDHGSSQAHLKNIAYSLESQRKWLREQEAFNSAVTDRFEALHDAVQKGNRDTSDELGKKLEQWQVHLSNQMSGIEGRQNALQKKEKARTEQLVGAVQAFDSTLKTSTTKLEARINAVEPRLAQEPQDLLSSPNLTTSEESLLAEKIWQVRKDLQSLSFVAQQKNQEIQTQLRNMANVSESQRQALREQETFNSAVMERFDAHDSAMRNSSREMIDELAKRQDYWQQQLHNQIKGISARLHAVEKKDNAKTDHLADIVQALEKKMDQQMEILLHFASGPRTPRGGSKESAAAVGDLQTLDNLDSLEVCDEAETYMARILSNRSTPASNSMSPQISGRRM